MKFTPILFGLFFVLLTIYNCPFAYAERKIADGSAVLESPVAPNISDNRTKILKEYLEQFNSPLAGSAQTFVKQADENSLDWRLVAAISGVESTFGKACVGIYNCWGWGIYGDNRLYFSSYDEAIQTISKGLRKNYMDKWGAQTVYQIGGYYAESETWADRVVYFMNRMEEFASKGAIDTLSITL